MMIFQFMVHHLINVSKSVKSVGKYEKANLVLNLVKRHFMVQEGIVSGYLVSSKVIEVDNAKVEVIEKFPPLVSVKGMKSFLGHVSFYRRFIQDFSKILKPFTHLLVKDIPFEFNEEYLSAFYRLKEALVSPPPQ